MSIWPTTQVTATTCLLLSPPLDSKVSPGRLCRDGPNLSCVSSSDVLPAHSSHIFPQRLSLFTRAPGSPCREGDIFSSALLFVNRSNPMQLPPPLLLLVPLWQNGAAPISWLSKRCSTERLPPLDCSPSPRAGPRIKRRTAGEAGSPQPFKAHVARCYSTQRVPPRGWRMVRSALRQKEGVKRKQTQKVEEEPRCWGSSLCREVKECWASF